MLWAEDGPEPLCAECGEGKGLGDGRAMPGDPTAMGDAAEGNGLPKEGLAGEGTMNPGDGVGWPDGAGLGCLMLGAGGLWRIP